MTAVIVKAQRTAIANFGGTLKDLKVTEIATQLASQVLADIDPALVDETILGQVLQGGCGQNPARQVALKSGIPQESPAMTVNKVCGSGLQTIMLAAQSILLGDSEVVLAGGMESMSQSPYLLTSSRWGSKFGHVNTLDSMIADGLWCAENDYHMGITAENLADKYNLTREAQDQFAANSQQKCEKAMNEGRFDDEISPITIKNRKGDIIFERDEFPRAGVTADSLAKLRPAFKKDGTVTAANASGINDGAAMVLVMSKEKAQELNLPILAEIVSYASAGVDPAEMGLGPVPATKKALAKANLTLEDIDLFELNEAFAAQSLAVMEELKVDPEKVNVNGGSIAIGHPIGASGARITVTLIHEMQKRNATYGVASLCIGGGQGVAIVLKR